MRDWDWQGTIAEMDIYLSQCHFVHINFGCHWYRIEYRPTPVSLVRYAAKVATSPQVFVRTARWHFTRAERGYFLSQTHRGCLDLTWWNDWLATTLAWVNATFLCEDTLRTKFLFHFFLKVRKNYGNGQKSYCGHKCGHDLQDLGRSRLQMGNCRDDTSKPRWTPVNICR